MQDSVRQLLASLRSNPTTWLTVACAGAEDGDRVWYDQHAADRYAVLLALQYDRRPADEPLLRYLFGQEIDRHTKEAYQGLYESLDLAAFLLARFRRVEDVWLFADAKFANFDTWCGFDVEYLFAAGVVPTLGYIQRSTHPRKEAVLERITPAGTPILTDADIARWWARKQQTYPASPESEPLETQIEQMLALGNSDEALRLLGLWETVQTRNAEMLRRLVSYRERLGDFSGALATQQELLTQEDSGSGREFLLQRLAQLYVKTGQYQEAWDTLQYYKAEFPTESTQAANRSWVEIALLVALNLTREAATGQAALAWAGPHLRHKRSTSLHLLELAAQTARHLGDMDAAANYERRARTMRRRIQAQLED